MNVKHQILKNIDESYGTTFNQAGHLLGLVAEVREKAGLEQLDGEKAGTLFKTFIKEINTDPKFYNEKKSYFENLKTQETSYLKKFIKD